MSGRLEVHTEEPGSSNVDGCKWIRDLLSIGRLLVAGVIAQVASCTSNGLTAVVQERECLYE